MWPLRPAWPPDRVTQLAAAILPTDPDTDDAALAAGASVSRRVAVSAALMVAMRFAFRGIGLASTLCLVRLLTPADFGIVGFATMAFSVLDAASDLSAGTALIRMAAPGRAEYDTAWTMGLIRGVVAASLFVAAAPLLAAYIHDPRVRVLSWWLGVFALLQSAQNVGMVDLQRQLRFNQVFWSGVWGKLLGAIVCVATAFATRSYWALMAGIGASQLAGLVLSYVYSRYRPRLSLAAWRELLSFSTGMTVINLQAMVDTYATAFTLGRMVGAQAIGFYQVAHQIAALPASEIGAPVRGPLYAGFARIAEDRPALRSLFLDGFGLVLLLVMPASIGIALLAHPITLLFLGRQWLPAGAVVALCAIYTLIDAVAHFCQPLFFALHRERTLIRTNGWVLAFRVPGLVLGTWLGGMEGAVWALIATAVLNAVLWLGALMRALATGPAALLRVSWRTIAGSTAMAVLVFWAAARWSAPPGELAALVRFGALSLLGATVQVVVQAGLFLAQGAPPGPERPVLRALGKLGERVGRKRQARGFAP